MSARTPSPRSRNRAQAGLTLVELMVTVTVIALVLAILTGVLSSTGRVQGRTVRRAAIQADSRQTLALMTNEIRQAGADPSMPPVGIVGIVSGDSVSVHIRADLSGDGVIQTTEPSEDVTYAYNAGQKIITRNPGSGAATLMSNVTSVRFTYFDDANLPVVPLPLSATDAARVHSIGLTITCENKDSTPLTLNTRIALRNM